MFQGFFQIALTLQKDERKAEISETLVLRVSILVVAIAPVLGTYLAQVFLGKKTFLDPIAAPVDIAKT